MYWFWTYRHIFVARGGVENIFLTLILWFYGIRQNSHMCIIITRYSFSTLEPNEFQFTLVLNMSKVLTVDATYMVLNIWIHIDVIKLMRMKLETFRVIKEIRKIWKLNSCPLFCVEVLTVCTFLCLLALIYHRPHSRFHESWEFCEVRQRCWYHDSAHSKRVASFSHLPSADKHKDDVDIFVVIGSNTKIMAFEKKPKCNKYMKGIAINSWYDTMQFLKWNTKYIYEILMHTEQDVRHHGYSESLVSRTIKHKCH